MAVIDSVATDLDNFQGGGHSMLQSTLLACMLVCRAWVHQARKYLYDHIYLEISQERNSYKQLKASLKINPAAVLSVKTLYIQFDDFTKVETLSAIMVSQKLPNLQCLYISNLELTSESPVLYKAAACLSSVYSLHLLNLQECTAAQLIKFINSFHSLSRLLVHSSRPEIGIKNQIFPTPCKISTFSLVHLDLCLVPGIEKLLSWSVKANSFIASLRHLKLRVPFGDDAQSRFKGVAELLERCSGSLEELTLELPIDCPSLKIGSLSKQI